jgi:KUP system potassium uptake protein
LASHEGEGGVFSLLSLLSDYKETIGIAALIGLLVLAAGFLFGDGLITPAISILSAVEGLRIATGFFSPYVIPITLAILIILFSFQYKGTDTIGKVFGPIMVVWFAVLALLGLSQIIQTPGIFQAINPLHALGVLRFLGIKGTMRILGAVVLAVTGGEALYADLGHFGLRPIRTSWLCFVYPALILNYLGQGAYLLSGHAVFEGNVFYSLVPHVLIYPMVILATAATVIASQALISGAYSLVSQAVALNFLPRFKINHTNKKREGQIYVPSVALILCIGSAALVLFFRSSTALASAYGLAESAVMLITSLSMLFIASIRWKWRWYSSVGLFGFFTLIDFAFLFSNSLKFLEGGYVPLAVGGGIFLIMMTWHWGKGIISQAYDSYAEKRKMSDLAMLKRRLAEGEGSVSDDRGQFVEADRVVIFLVPKSASSPDDPVPVILRAHMRNNGSIPRYSILLHIARAKNARVRGERYAVTDFGNNLVGIEARFGFMEDVNIETIVGDLKGRADLHSAAAGLSYDRYLVEVGAEQFAIDHANSDLSTRIQVHSFRFLQRFATPTYRYFGIKENSTLSTVALEIGVNDAGGTIILPELDLVGGGITAT